MRVVGAGDYTTLDVVAWFAAHGALKRRFGRGKHAVTCPWSSEHSTPDQPNGTDTVVWQARQRTLAVLPLLACALPGRDIRDVMQLWGDADGFCSRTWRRSA